MGSHCTVLCSNLCGLNRPTLGGELTNVHKPVSEFVVFIFPESFLVTFAELPLF